LKQLWQFRNIRRYSSGLIFGEQLGGRPPARLTLIIDIGELLTGSVATMKQAAGPLRNCDGLLRHCEIFLRPTQRNTTKAIMSASEISKASTQTITSSFRPNIAVGCASEGLNSPTRRRLASVSDVVIARMISITPT
jgi:hypothetical protein